MCDVEYCPNCHCPDCEGYRERVAVERAEDNRRHRERMAVLKEAQRKQKAGEELSKEEEWAINSWKLGMRLMKMYASSIEVQLRMGSPIYDYFAGDTFKKGKDAEA